MHLGLRELASFLDQHGDDRALVLATVIATEGSSYRKPGAMMLIRENAEFAGLISGGCLEGNLVEKNHGKEFVRLVRVLKQKKPAREALRKVYSLSPIRFEEKWKAWVLETYPTR